jgi:hypothetical protein
MRSIQKQSHEEEEEEEEEEGGGRNWSRLGPRLDFGITLHASNVCLRALQLTLVIWINHRRILIWAMSPRLRFRPSI